MVDNCGLVHTNTIIDLNPHLTGVLVIAPIAVMIFDQDKLRESIWKRLVALPVEVQCLQLGTHDEGI
jgi:hypothetical protein